MTESESAVEQAIAARIARVRAEGERRQQQREELAAARNAGLARRHAQKIRNLATPPDGAANDPVKDATVPAAPPVRRTDHCPACRTQRPTKRVASVTIARLPHDVVRCEYGPCGLVWCVRTEQPRPASTAA